MNLGRHSLLITAIVMGFTFSARAQSSSLPDLNKPATEPFPFAELGARATAEYMGDAIGITAAADGARLHTVFQKLSGSVTRTGLRLESSTERGGSLSLVADIVSRSTGGSQNSTPAIRLPSVGTVSVDGKVVIFARPGLTEEYSVSADGVRQDFIVAERPTGAGDLRVELALTGARAEAIANGARLTLAGSGRALVYNRLRVVDAAGKELSATLEVLSTDRLAVRVADADAAYPVRIDPTFSDANWISMNNGVSGVAPTTVTSMVMDGAGNLYVGGAFTAAGNLDAGFIAKWSGTTWSTLGSGMNSTVQSLALDASGNLYAGGAFTTAGGVAAARIAKWNGTAWSALGAGLNNQVLAMAVDGAGNVYAGGIFTISGSLTNINRVAKWNGTTWSALGTGMDSSVSALALDASGILYAGGGFTNAGGVLVNFIASWNGASWSALGGGMDSSVLAIKPDGLGNVYAGGAFTNAGGLVVHQIAKWNGSVWSALGLGMNATVSALTMDGAGNLYAGGSFSAAGGATILRVAKWNGTAWTGFGATTVGLNSGVAALVLDGAGGFYAGGGFTAAGTMPCPGITKWNGSSYSTLGTTQMDGQVSAAVTDAAGNLYVGGNFTRIGGVAANYIAKWNGATWSTLGAGMNGSVSSLVLDGAGNLYAGGIFSQAGGVTVNCIAKWNGATWSPLGSGVAAASRVVLALAVDGAGNLYAGGSFQTIGGVSANFVAKWNGSVWSALGPGMNSNVNALVMDGAGILYAGGAFTNSSGIHANFVAKWDGTAWSNLGTGMDNTVTALVINRGNQLLYAAGAFLQAGGVPALRVAKWDGANWSSVGTGMNSQVQALTSDPQGNLYAGGFFSTADGVAANRVAQWTGSAWEDFGSGADNFVSALAVFANRLYVGGAFAHAGNKLSPFIAQTLLQPDIDVAIPFGTDLTDFVSRVTVGAANVGSSLVQTVTIQNTGEETLTLGTIWVDGNNAGDFTLGTIGATTLIPGASTTFTLTFTPGSGGVRSAALHIASDDDEGLESPFDIMLLGTGNGPTTYADSVLVTGQDASVVIGQPNFTQNVSAASTTQFTEPIGVALSKNGVLAIGGHSNSGGAGHARVVLFPGGVPTVNGAAASVIVGQASFTGTSTALNASTLNGGTSVAFSPDGTKLIVADGFRNRVLIWNTIPTVNGTAANVVIGQTSFTAGGAGTSATQLNGPFCVHVTPDGKLLIADYFNSRVLIYNSIPTANGAAANVVIGQSTFTTSTGATTASNLRNPEGIAVAPDGRLLIADRGNNRVLIYTGVPTANGAVASTVIGQTSFTTLTSGAGTNTTSTTMANPASVSVSPAGQLAVSDILNNRVLFYDSVPTANGAAATAVLGQPDFTSNTAFNGGISAHSMGLPFQSVFTADGRLIVGGASGNYRVLVFGKPVPILTVPANMVVEATSAAGAVVTFAASATEGVPAPVLTLTYSQDPGTVFPIGTTTVSVTVTDDLGNTVTKSFTVTVQDTTAPVVASHANVIVEATSPAGAVVNYAAGSASDAVGVTSLTYSKNSGTIFPLGVTTVTISATDAANNTGTRTFTVTVQDTTGPVFTLLLNITVEATGPGGAVANFGAGATDPNGGESFKSGFENEVIDLSFGSGNAEVWYPATVPGGWLGNEFKVVGDWKFNLSAGLVSGDAGGPAAFGPLTSQEGLQHAFVQAGVFPVAGENALVLGSIETANAFPVVAGKTYVVSFYQASRTDWNIVNNTGNAAGELTYSVMLNDNTGSTEIFRRSTASGEGWARYTAAFVATATGNIRLAFHTLASVHGDDAIFIDDVHVSGPVTVAYSQAPGTGFALGTTTVTVTATDGLGNSSTGNFTVSVRDTTPPALTVPASITAEATSAAGAVVSFAASATDAVTASPIIMYSAAPGSVFPLGVTTVTVTARDAAGNTSTGAFTVTVRDTIAPVLTLPANLTIEATSPAGAVANFSASATDAVTAVPAISYSAAPGSTFALGTTTVNVTAIDDAGNVRTGAFTVTVQDTTAPVITTPSNPVAEATSPAGAVVSYTASASDIVSGAVTVFASAAPGSTFALGTTTVMLSATDAAGNTGIASFTVTVVDTTPPVLTVPAPITAEATSAAGAVVTFAASAFDAVTASPAISYSAASGSMFPLGTTTVNVSATDAAGNTTSGSFTVTVVDTTGPVITAPANIVTEATSALGVVVTFSASASDTVSGSIPVLSSAPSGATFPLGTTLVNLNATDAAGNMASASFTVTVRDTTPPTVFLPGAITVEATSTSGAAVSFAATATDAVTASPLIGYSAASGSTFAIGTSTVIVTARDAAGNITTGSFTVSVVDTTAPVITAPANITAEATSAAGAAVSFTATATDAASTPFVTALPAPGSVFPFGTTTVTITALDAAGNTSMATFTVTVRDTTQPVLTLPANMSVFATSAAGAVVTFVATATDAVTASPSVTYSQAPGTVFPQGTTIVTVTATDAAGNATTGTFTINVLDGAGLVFVSLSSSVANLWPPNHQVVPVTLTALATDSVGITSLKIISVTSSEVDNGLGDGDTAGDIQITGDLSVNLRAERSGKGNGRTYTIIVEAKDSLGRTATKSVAVVVPKNQSGK